MGGYDCRWFIYSPGAAQLHLNLAVSVHGTDAQLLIYEGAETQVYMHEDVLNATVFAPTQKIVRDAMSRPRLAGLRLQRRAPIVLYARALRAPA